MKRTWPAGQINETCFAYDGARIIEEKSCSGSTPTTYTYGNYVDEVLTRDIGSQRLYYHQNALFSVVALTDANGAVAERYTYDAYGRPTILDPQFSILAASAVGNRVMFTGREFDAECGLFHYRARSYSPTLGRFVSRDPLGYVDGMNLYEYGRSAPRMFSDAYGLTSTDNSFDCAGKTLRVMTSYCCPADVTTIESSVCSAYKTLRRVNDALWNHEYVKPWGGPDHEYTNRRFNRYFYRRQSGALKHADVERVRSVVVDVLDELDDADGTAYQCDGKIGDCSKCVGYVHGLGWTVHLCEVFFYRANNRTRCGTIIHELSHLYQQTDDYSDVYTHGVNANGLPVYQQYNELLKRWVTVTPVTEEQRYDHASTLEKFTLGWYQP